MQPTLMTPDQIETAVQAAQQDDLALIIDLPRGELKVTNANDLRAHGDLRYALGDVAVFDLSRVNHMRAVDRNEVEETWFRLWP